MAATTVMMSLCQNCAACKEKESESVWAGVKSSPAESRRCCDAASSSALLYLT